MKKVMLLAHRGFSGKYPENSPLAFHKAVEETSADGFESDVHITKDGKLIIFHDATVERTSNGTGFIKDHTYEEMLELDIGSWKSPEFAGQHIWTFDQLLDFCDETNMLLNMELKNYEVFYEGLEQRVIDAISAHKMQDRVFVSSFNHISMQKFKELCPDIKTGLLYDKPYLDIDKYIEKQEGRKIKEIFAEEGEEGFRRIETMTLASLAFEPKSIISCGGGIVGSAVNRAIVKALGNVIYLKVPCDEAIGRISDPSTRPMLSGPRPVREIYDERLPLYRDVADITINTSGKSVGATVQQVIGALRRRGLL